MRRMIIAVLSVYGSIIGLFLLSLAVMAVAHSAPFVVSAPLDETATFEDGSTAEVAIGHCGFRLDNGARVDVPVAIADGGKICKMDLGPLNIAGGNHVIDATAIAADTLWGRLESAPSSPLAFVRPVTPGEATGLRLVP